MILETVELKDGMDSGAVSDKIKFQVFVDGLGVCGAPECSKRLLQDKTKIGECAHIIPKVVGSHPTREDYKTSFEDRKKIENLLFLCEIHHKVIDNPLHAERFRTEVIRKWKSDHEAWAAGVTKSPHNMPQDLKEILTNLKNQISQEANGRRLVIEKLLNTCRDLLNRYLINEAKVFLAQIDVMLVEANDSTLNSKADLLSAIICIRDEQIPEAKEQLLQTIKLYPHYVEPMLEYIELCDSAPEPNDDLLRIEKLARDLADNHPRFILIDVERERQKLGKISDPKVFESKMEDARLNARLICHHSIFCHSTGDSQKRDALINLWQTELPSSPRPNLFRVLYRTIEVTESSEDLNPQEILSAIELSKLERDAILTKDPLSKKDKILWLVQEMKLELAYMQALGGNRELEEIQRNLISLICESYFDNFIDSWLPIILGILRVEIDQWRKISLKIQESKVSPSQKTIESLFLHGMQHEELLAELLELLKKYNANDLLNILQALQDEDAQKIAEIANTKNDPRFSLMLIQSINNHEITAQLADLLKVSAEHQEDLVFIKLKSLSLSGKVDDAIALISTLSINKASPFALQNLERIASANMQWHLFIPLALKLLDFDITPAYRIYLEGNLALAYSYQGDDTGVVDHAEKALQNLEELGLDNSRRILYALCKALSMKGFVNEACEKFQQYANIERDAELLLAEADFYLKSTLANNHDKALELILKAFEEADTCNERMYHNALLPLIDLQKAGKIADGNETKVEEGLFIKLDKFSDGWFYIGKNNRQSFGAQIITPEMSSYKAVIHKAVDEEIAWPADKFSDPNLRHKILHIVSPVAFLSIRAHQAMDNKAKLGSKGVWSIRAIKEDGSIDKENIKNFFEETFRQNHEFFTTYSSSLIPFSFLCRMEGGLAKAVGKISAEQKGFIHCNNGTPGDLEAQKITTTDSLSGNLCFIDGLSAVVLAEANLLGKVIDNIPNLGVSTSVIRLLREMADDLLSSGDGRLVFAKNDFVVRERNKGKEETLRNKLLAAATLLDNLPNKVIGKVSPKPGEDKKLDSVLPDYFVDAFRFSQENNAHILTDDPLLIMAYGISGETSLPKHFSSLSLVRSLADMGQIDWDSYLKYFALLSVYRYRFLPVSVDDLMKSVFPKSSGGFVGFTPQNISFFNLSLTLSQDYGVETKVAIDVLSSFFTTLIKDNSVLPEMVDEIFAITIVRSLSHKDKKIIAKEIFRICNQAVMKMPWISRNNHKKLEILLIQLSKFCQSFDPMVMEIPSLLKSGLK